MTKTTLELMRDALNAVMDAEREVILTAQAGDPAIFSKLRLTRAWDDVNALMCKVEEIAIRRQALKDARKSNSNS